LLDDLKTGALARIALDFGMLWQGIAFECSGPPAFGGKPVARVVQLKPGAVLNIRPNCPAQKR
jgi:hypothetical protein